MHTAASRPRLVLLACAALAVTGAAACSQPQGQEPPDEPVDLAEVCATVDAALVERLLPSAELDEGHTTGEGFASARCGWRNGSAQERSGTLDVTVDAAAGPADGTDPQALLSAICLGAEASPDGPGELSCSTSEPGPDGGGVVSVAAVEGAVVVDLVFTRLAGGEVSDDERADLEQVVTVLLAAMPTP